MPTDIPPDFSQNRPKLNWEINVPTLLTVVGAVATMFATMASTWTTMKVNEANTDWRLRVLETGAVETRTTEQKLAESEFSTAKTVDRLSQTMDWMAKNQK